MAKLRRSGMKFDFRRICKFGSGLPSLSDCLFHFSGLKEGSELNEINLILAQLYHKFSDRYGIIVKSTNVSVCVNNCDHEMMIEHLMKLRHPCLSGIIGVILRSELSVLRIVVHDLGDASLSRIVSSSPSWWTPRAKSKAIVGLVLGLCFAHRFGIFHGHLTGDNIFLKEDGVIQITGFGMNDYGDLERHDESEVDIVSSSGASLTRKADIRGFTRIVSEIVFGRLAEPCCGSSGIPSFVLEMIESGNSADMKGIESFRDILQVLNIAQPRIIDDLLDFSRCLNIAPLLVTISATVLNHEFCLIVFPR
jgi:serine/threonine protein kinase